MSQKANPTLIGVFVFGAILIAVGAAVFFGSADFFAKKQTFVSYFNQSVSGLSIGSNVKFKGVTVGKVTKVQLGFVGEDNPGYAKVFYQVDENFVVKEFVDLIKYFGINRAIFTDKAKLHLTYFT